MLLLLALVALSSAKIYFHETFDNLDRPFKLSAGRWYADESDKGLQTTENSKFYITAAKLDEEFTNKDSNLVVQYNLKFEQNIDCGGGYIKLMPKNALDSLEKFTPDSQYNIMFGPDVCGASKEHMSLLTIKEKNHLVRKEVKCESDNLSHLYTLIIKPDNTYTVKIDGVVKQTGKFDEDWDLLEPKKIDDPSISKPADWVDLKEIDDPEDVKPEEEWDDEDDGEWEAPVIENPDFKGEWKPKKIPNPEYKGEWVQPQIDNPAYVYDPELYKFDSFAYIGIDVWQVKAGTIYNDILITDSIEEAEEEEKKVLEKNKLEKIARDKILEEEKAAEKAAEEAKAAEEEPIIADEIVEPVIEKEEL
ncbi:Calreticulin [Entamoeba marina]